jgi:TIR domain
VSTARSLHIFLNYRREETSGHAGRLYDALAARFDDDHVFMDIDRIEPGLDFTEVINEAVASCDVLISLIGSRWLTASDAKGRRRLEKPDDFVRLELEAALERGVRVIPALVQNAEMPSSDELPDGLRQLALRHAIELSDTRWAFDVGKLIETLERVQTHLAEQEVRQRADVEAKARAEQEERRRADAEAKARAEQEERQRADAEAKARAEQEERQRADADSRPQGETARLPSEAPPLRPRKRWSALIHALIDHRLLIDDAFILGSAIIVLVGSSGPWGHADGTAADIDFVRSFRVPVILLTLGALALLAALIRRRDARLACALVLCAGIATGLMIAVLIRLRQEEDKWSGVIDVATGWGAYVAAVGSACLLISATYAAVRMWWGRPKSVNV